MSPLLYVALHNGPALVVVASDAELGHSILRRHTKLFVDLVLNGQTMAVPAKAPHDIASLHGPITRHDVFYRACNQMAVMRQTRRKRWPVIENEGLLALSFFQRLFEGVRFLPQIEDLVLHINKGKRAVF